MSPTRTEQFVKQSLQREVTLIILLFYVRCRLEIFHFVSFVLLMIRSVRQRNPAQSFKGTKFNRDKWQIVNGAAHLVYVYNILSSSVEPTV